MDRIYSTFSAVLAAVSSLFPLFGALATIVACEKKPEMGYLLVDAPGKGAYEIYRIANETPLQFVSEQAGDFGQEVALPPGSYHVLADCSSESVIIYPGRHERLTVHRVEFVPPHPPGALDSFSIQCNRSDKTRSLQLLTNRYELNVFSGKLDLLVGMVPMRVEFEGTESNAASDKEPSVVKHRLSALQVADFAGNRDDVSYFVSPVDELISITKYQRFGAWEFLLPGRYALEVNGTRMSVDLKEGEERVIKPALLHVATASTVDLEQPSRIKGSPWLVEINSGHWLNFNETYPILPGTAKVGISGSSQSVEITPTEGQLLELTARSVTVDLGCAVGEMNCLGDKDISLSLPGEPYPFVESVTDIPVLFIDQGQPVQVGVGGSRDIAFEIPANVHDKTLQVGYAKIIPVPQHRPGQVTDFLRVDTTGAPFSGHTLDIILEHQTMMPLIAGNYVLTHFISATSADGARNTHAQPFHIDPGKTVELEVPVYFSEKRYSLYKRRRDEKAGGESATQ